MTLKMMAVLGLGILCIVWLIALEAAGAEPAPPREGQPHQDIFESTNGTDLQPFNPMTAIVRDTQEARYRLITMPSCVTGTIPDDLNRLAVELQENVDFSLIRNDLTYDFTVRINCGTDHIRVCGSLSVYCLGRGFPFVVDIDISDLLSQWQPDTRLSILCHELCGHALGTWMEQYCLGQERGQYPVGHPCRNLPRFTPTPNWPDFMNTGALSRHGFTDIEIERWERTLYELEIDPAPVYPWGPCDLSWNGCWHDTAGLWIGTNGWAWSPLSGPQPFRCDTSWCGYYNTEADRWISSGGDVFDWVEGWQLHPLKGGN